MSFLVCQALYSAFFFPLTQIYLKTSMHLRGREENWRSCVVTVASGVRSHSAASLCQRSATGCIRAARDPKTRDPKTEAVSPPRLLLRRNISAHDLCSGRRKTRAPVGCVRLQTGHCQEPAPWTLVKEVMRMMKERYGTTPFLRMRTLPRPSPWVSARQALPSWGLPRSLREDYPEVTWRKQSSTLGTWALLIPQTVSRPRRPRSPRKQVPQIPSLARSVCSGASKCVDPRHREGSRKRRAPGRDLFLQVKVVIHPPRLPSFLNSWQHLKLNMEEFPSWRSG